jgi:hypothetical protein
MARWIIGCRDRTVLISGEVAAGEDVGGRERARSLDSMEKKNVVVWRDE